MTDTRVKNVLVSFFILHYVRAPQSEFLWVFVYARVCLVRYDYVLKYF